MAAVPARPRVVVACQGGGSHTAFTAGVLSRMLSPDVLGSYDIVGLSGTSGGAICATLAWSALVDGEPERAADLLTAFWTGNSATSPPERMLNAWTLWAAQLADVVALPATSPYDSVGATLGMNQLRSLLRRAVDFAGVGERARLDPAAPLLLLGAVDVMSGRFKAFDSRRGEIDTEAVLASAAIPTLFRSVHTGGGVYWDGLFSQNPPVRELLDARPDELWVIQINPQERGVEPRTVSEIADRRNELAGNLSLYQELHFIEKIDTLLDEGVLVGERYRPITVRVLEMTRPPGTQSFGAASKLNRDPLFIRRLVGQGRVKADEFLAALAFERAWRSRDAAAVAGFFADDCEVSADPAVLAADPPGAGRSSAAWAAARGSTAVADLLSNRLAETVRVDLTRKQIAGDRVTWTVRTADPAGRCTRGRAEARFAGGRVTSFRLERLPD